MKRSLLYLMVFVLCFQFSRAQVQTLNIKDTGYRSIWYSNEPSKDEYVYKYSGGLGTYPANHYPFSIYVSKVNKTFFCYGGTDKDGKTLLHSVSYFDHQTKMVPKPTVVLDKKTNNAHDNPVMNIDKEGYIWIFSTAHGTNGPSYVHKSMQPYDIGKFEQVQTTKIENDQVVPMNNFSYLQSWYQPENGFINLFTHYDRKVIENQPSKPRRTISYMTSKDGVSYSEWKDLAIIEEGHYQTSGQFNNKLGSAFNFHPIKVGENGLNYRSNLYYIQTQNFGKTWQSAKGDDLSLPLTAISNSALVKDYHSLGLNVYINDLAFDAKGNPIILYLTSKGYEAGPENGPRVWYTARFTGADWEILPLTTSDNNYDMGSLYIDKKGVWRVVGPTTTGPQPFNTGGEMVLWTSKNQGKTWKSKTMTANSEFNHSYARRPVNVHQDFYAFWADGNGRKFSKSSLYFSDQKGNVYQLPTQMDADFAKPRLIKVKK
ncbi:BNR-4 repeat-containing protein [Pedobacter insulae]|uniref:BNR repeat-containing family member n=1 Tax=Pedobacter insulae TaxID=414048 RepID=A0A1I2V221_9SPHI|nr:BNR-4 repeat-containing protein [Pedobacter insulae]SFG83434.1 BNR repeat-containing family member [Pedobacter insulae]